jgi:hypothetical protein
MLTIRIVPEIGEAGDIFLNITVAGSTDRVGPLREGEECVAVLSEETAGATPPTARMKRLSQKQERRNAELLGGRTQPGSGSSNRAKGDVRKLGEYRGESKFTFSLSYHLERRVLEKITSECSDGEKPILFLDFKNKESGKSHGSYVILHETDFEELVSAKAVNNQRLTRNPRRGT